MTKWPALEDMATKETQKSDGIGCSLTVWLWSMSLITSSRRGSRIEQWNIGGAHAGGGRDDSFHRVSFRQTLGQAS
jgi:hypothetical protein